MQATAWNNGAHHASGAGYGLRVRVLDRDRHFDESWAEVVLEIPGRGSVAVPVAGSFWRRCSELRSAELGRWFRELALAPWVSAKPPAFRLEPLEANRFRVEEPG